MLLQNGYCVLKKLVNQKMTAASSAAVMIIKGVFLCLN